MSLLLTESDPRALCLRINENSPDGGLFQGDRTGLHPESRLPWRISPEPFWLTPEQHSFLERLGPVLLSFYRASNLLYHQSVKGLQPAFVHRYLEAGKPERIVDFGRMNRLKSQLPLVMRPDLVLTAEGVRITELDSIPGGMGFTGQISGLYADIGYDLIGGADGLVDGFYDAIRAGMKTAKPVVAIVVSDESEPYRAEMNWLAEQLHAKGNPVFCRHPRELRVDDDGLLIDDGAGAELRVDAVYRFFELFDLPNIPKAELITYFAKKNALRLTPPLKHFLEEKMWMALLHHPQLIPFWERELGRETTEELRELIPRTWVLDATPTPPHTVIADLHVRGRLVSSWEELEHITKKERELVIKTSGFSELAYGSRGVTIGHDVPEEEWVQALKTGLDSFESNPYVLQKFHKAARLEARYYDFFEDRVRTMHGRVLLRPYYYVADDDPARQVPKLAGVQAIVCPADKKVLHGMTDAVLVPCAVRDDKADRDASAGPA